MYRILSWGEGLTIAAFDAIYQHPLPADQTCEILTCLESSNRRFSTAEYCLILLTFSFCLTGALLLPTEQCPDEAGRLLLSDWISATGRLPTGREKEVLIDGWGFSYALRPYLCAIVGAAFKSVAALFTDSPRVLLAASRMCSVLSVTGCCIFCLRLGGLLLERRSSALLFACLVCFLPQVMFLGMYQNNDSLSLFAVSMMLYYMAEGRCRKWPVKSCVGLAAGISIGLLSYYSVYGWILMCAVFCIAPVLLDGAISDKKGLILKRGALIAGLCILFAGWFFLRNYFVLDGDVFGLSSELRSREYFRPLGYVRYDYVCLRDRGISIIYFLKFGDFEWIRVSAQSFVGVFGYMIHYLPLALYRSYGFVLAFGMLLTLGIVIRQKQCKMDGLLLLTMVMSVGITLALHFWQSYARDYQPQGRYIISLSLLLGYVVAFGFDRMTLPVRRWGKEIGAQAPSIVLTVIWLLLFAWALFGTMTKMVE